MSRLFVTAGLLAASLAMPGSVRAQTQAQAQAQAQSAEGAQANPNELICRRARPAVGTIMSRRVCKTRAEWTAEAAGIDANAAQNSLERRPVRVPRNGG
jgi:hypothetical protein